MNIKSLLITARLTDEQRDRLALMLPDAEITYKWKDVTSEDIGRAEVVFGFMESEHIDGVSGLKWVQTSSAGSDHLTDALPEGALLTNSSGAYGPAISEHMLAMLFAAFKRLPEHYVNQKAHKWVRSGNVRIIEGSVLLSLGLGDIGSAFAQKMKALGAHTIGVRRLDSGKPDYMDEVHLGDALDELIPRADIIALSLPNNAETRHIIDARRMALMKPGAVIINVGRGAAIDTDALIEGLKKGQPGFACLDVTDPEPLPAGHPLWDLENVLITPHCSGYTAGPDTPARAAEIFLQNVEAYLEGRPLHNLVDLETGYRSTVRRDRPAR